MGGVQAANGGMRLFGSLMSPGGHRSTVLLWCACLIRWLLLLASWVLAVLIRLLLACLLGGSRVFACVSYQKRDLRTT